MRIICHSTMISSGLEPCRSGKEKDAIKGRFLGQKVIS